MEWRELSEKFAQWLIANEKVQGKRTGDRVDGRCPRSSHEDKNPSFSYYVTGAGWKCSCGHGKASELMGELNLDLGVTISRVEPSVLEEYDYRDEKGTLLYQVQRMIPKSFRQRSVINPSLTNADPQWREGKGAMEGVRRIPYRLNQISQLKAGTPLYIVDGEKDADSAFYKLGVMATCHVGGMGNWRIESTRLLSKYAITIIADRDGGEGERQAKKLQDLFQSLGVKPAVIEMPGQGIKDLSDWIDAGGGKEELEELASQREKWEDITRSPIVSMKDLVHLIGAQIDYAIRPVAPKGSLIIVQGAPKSGKSVFCLYLGGCAATGKWPGDTFHVEHPLKTLLVEYEDSPLLVVNRLSRYMMGMHLDRNALPENLFLCDYPDLWLDSAAHKEALIHEIKSRGIELVILDTLSYIHRAKDENSSADMKPVMANLKRVAKESGAAIMLIHHTGKGAKEKSVSERGRGSSVIAAAADVILDWGDRKKTNKTPVEFVSKFDDGFDFEVEYVPCSDGSVQWKIISETRENSPKPDRTVILNRAKSQRQEILDLVRRETLKAPSGFPLSEFVEKTCESISSKKVYRILKGLEEEDLVSLMQSGSKNNMKTIRAINQDKARNVP